MPMKQAIYVMDYTTVVLILILFLLRHAVTVQLESRSKKKAGCIVKNEQWIIHSELTRNVLSRACTRMHAMAAE